MSNDKTPTHPERYEWLGNANEWKSCTHEEAINLSNAKYEVREIRPFAHCTCPTGDGSLRHPCPSHRATLATVKHGGCVQLGVKVSDDDRAVLQRLQDALPTAGINGWAKGVEVLESLLRQSLDQPVIEGYQAAFYELADMLGMTAQPCSPKEVWETQIRPALQAAIAAQGPIPMVLHCPRCHLQHIDAPDERTPDWQNQPHRSHLCHGCGLIWRPADVPTIGVEHTQTSGRGDSNFAPDPSGAQDPIGFANSHHLNDTSTDGVILRKKSEFFTVPVYAAQPSPGGQGDALLESLVARWRKDADEVGTSSNTLCQKIANCTMRHAAELQAVLAARQPVGSMSSEASQVARDMVGHCIEHRLCMGMDEGFASFDPDVEHPFVQELREFAEDARQPVCATVKDSLTVGGGQPVGEPVTVPGAPTSCRHCDSTDLKWFAHVRTLNDVQQGRLNTHDVGCVFVLGCEECSETLRVVKADDIAALLNAAPPVHARDLGQIWQQAFYDTAHSYRRNKSRMWVLQMMKERVQALLDSQAVGK